MGRVGKRKCNHVNDVISAMWKSCVCNGLVTNDQVQGSFAPTMIWLDCSSKEPSVEERPR